MATKLTPNSLCRACRPLPLKVSEQYRLLSTSPAQTVRLRRAMLYVPGSNPRMLEKSLTSPADSICYDLEDAVAPGKKVDARKAVCEMLDVSRHLESEEGADCRGVGNRKERSWLESMLSGLVLRRLMLMISYVLALPQSSPIMSPRQTQRQD